jgi:hypothetical protein
MASSGRCPCVHPARYRVKRLPHIGVVTNRGKMPIDACSVLALRHPSKNIPTDPRAAAAQHKATMALSARVRSGR